MIKKVSALMLSILILSLTGCSSDRRVSIEDNVPEVELEYLQESLGVEETSNSNGEEILAEKSNFDFEIVTAIRYQNRQSENLMVIIRDNNKSYQFDNRTLSQKISAQIEYEFYNEMRRFKGSESNSMLFFKDMVCFTFNALGELEIPECSYRLNILDCNTKNVIETITLDVPDILYSAYQYEDMSSGTYINEYLYSLYMDLYEKGDLKTESDGVDLKATFIEIDRGDNSRHSCYVTTKIKNSSDTLFRVPCLYMHYNGGDLVMSPNEEVYVKPGEEVEVVFDTQSFDIPLDLAIKSDKVIYTLGSSKDRVVYLDDGMTASAFKSMVDK